MLEENYGVTAQTINAIGRFTINWFLFENQYLKNHASFDAIYSLNLGIFDYSNEETDFKENLVGYLNTRYSQIDEKAIMEALFTDDKKSEQIRRILSYLCNKEESINTCVFCIYRIRNNMFHGEKAIWSINNQLELIESATNLLEVFTNQAAANLYHDTINSVK